MKPFDLEKAEREFLNHSNETYPVIGRKYTITHSDETAGVLVSIGTTYALCRVGEMKDEVYLTIECRDGRISFVGMVQVDGENEEETIKRQKIFLKEMNVALRALRYADREFFAHYQELDASPILIHFRSAIPKYDRFFYFGNMQLYKQVLPGTKF